MKSNIGALIFLLAIVTLIAYTCGSGKSKSEKNAQKINPVSEGFIYSNETGLPIEGALAGLKGKPPVSSTEKDGHFYIDAKPGDSISFSAPGYKNKTIALKDCAQVFLETE